MSSFDKKKWVSWWLFSLALKALAELKMYMFVNIPPCLLSFSLNGPQWNQCRSRQTSPFRQNLWVLLWSKKNTVSDKASTISNTSAFNDDVIRWKHFPLYWLFVRGIHRSPVNSPHKGQWRGALMFSLICAWINGWVNSRKAGDLRRHRAHYDVIVMFALWSSLVFDILSGTPQLQFFSGGTEEV